MPRTASKIRGGLSPQPLCAGKSGQVSGMSRGKTIRSRRPGVRANAEAITPSCAPDDCAFAKTRRRQTAVRSALLLEIIHQSHSQSESDQSSRHHSFIRSPPRRNPCSSRTANSSGLFRRSAQKWLKHLIFPRVRRLSPQKLRSRGAFSTGWPARKVQVLW